VCALMEKTETWRGWWCGQYRLAYGASRGVFSAPRVVQWVDAGTMARIESVSVGELFAGVALEHNESRLLMISRLVDEGTERQAQVRRELGALYAVDSKGEGVPSMPFNTAPRADMGELRGLLARWAKI
jgi:hypothetical protein